MLKSEVKMSDCLDSVRRGKRRYSHGRGRRLSKDGHRASVPAAHSSRDHLEQVRARQKAVMPLPRWRRRRA